MSGADKFMLLVSLLVFALIVGGIALALVAG